MEIDLAAKLANDLILKHCPAPWSWCWSNAKTQYGLCQFGPKNIKLSRPLTLANDEVAFTNVVLHEIAHVLAGDKAGHGPVWRAHARRLGCPPTRCTQNTTPIEGQVLGTCKDRCGFTVTVHRITHASWTRCICTRCSVRSARHWVYLDWTRNGQPIPCPKRPAPRRRRSRRRSWA